MRRAAILLLCVLAGCPKRHVDPAAEALRAALAAADRAWDARESGGLDAVDRALDAVPVADHPEVAWRRTRVGVARGLMAPDPRSARRDFAAARGASMDCVLAAPTVARAWSTARGAEALVDLPYDRLPCAAWAGYAWARWLTTWEPGAGTVDVPAVRALLDRGAVDAEKDVAEHVVWGRALVDATQGIEPRALLDAHRRDDDDAWVWWADVQRWLPDAPSVLVPDRGPRAPEERVAYARISEARDGARP